MARWMTALVVLMLGAAGCGGDAPKPTLAFPDTLDPSVDVVSGDDTTVDMATPEDLLGDQGPTPTDTLEDMDLAEDTPGPDLGEDVVSSEECEGDDDCAHLSDDPCTFWFCHPGKKTCMPATFSDGSPCDDGDVCTVGDTCQDAKCTSGEVIPPPQGWDDPCNELVCDPATGWHPEPVNGPCDDGDVCTEDDQCHDGSCVGGPNICIDPICGDAYCDDLETCETCPEDCGSCESNCCEPHEGPGCNNPICEEIICATDSFCCTNNWDQICASNAEEFCPSCGGATCGDGFCDFGEDCQTCPVDCNGNCNSDCCFIHPGVGCAHDACEDKVCQQDPACCENSWDAFCVEGAQAVCGICN